MLLYVLSIILILLIIVILLFKYNVIGSNNDNKNKNTNINEKHIDEKKDVEENISKKDDKKESKENSSGPAQTEEEENKNEKEGNVTINIELIGDEEVEIKQGEKYNEPGVKAIDSNGNDVSDKITIENNVNIDKKGEYRVIYSYGKSIAIRRVIVK